MQYSKSKFPLGIYISVCILWILVIIAIIFIVDRAIQPVQIGPFYRINPYTSLNIQHVIAIATIVTAAIIATANLILVAVTKDYANQTAKMVNYYYQTRKDDLRPLFVPYKEGYEIPKEDNFNTIRFKFTNAGDLALFVEIKAEKRPENRPAINC